MQSNGGVGVAGDGYIPIPGSRGSKKTGPWTPAEDALLNQLVKEYGLQEGSIKQQPMGTLAGAAGTAPEEPSGWAQVRRETPTFVASPFCYTENDDQFAKIGSGRTQEKLRKAFSFLQVSARLGMRSSL